MTSWGDPPAVAAVAPRYRPQETLHKRLLAAAVAVMLGPLAALGDERPPGPESVRALPAPPPPPASGGVAGVSEYQTGFEPGEGFAVGFVEAAGSPPWSAFSTSSLEARISAAHPAAGEQHLRISLDASLPGNTFTGAFSPLLAPGAPGPVTFSLDVAISDTDGARYDVLLQADSQSLITARVRFDRFANILVVDDPGPGFQFVDTGVDWTPGAYATLTICIDPALDSIEYFYDGEPLYTSVAGIFAGDVVEQVAMLSNNNQVSDHGDFDNLRIEAGIFCDDDVPTTGDICTDCIPLVEGAFAGTTIGASGDADISSCALNDTVDRWYCYTASCSGMATAGTCSAADFDTTITVFDTCDGTELVCNDDASGCLDFTSEAVWPVVSGATYLVRVSGFDETVGDYTLTIDCESGAPANDDCAAATPIEDGRIAFDTTGASTDGPPHDACLLFADDQVNQDIWYTYVATCPGELTISTCGSASFDTRLAVYQGTECPVTDERLLVCNDDGPGCPDFTSLIVVPVQPGQSYLIRVGGFDDNEGLGVLDVSCSIPGGPDNNTCANAQVINAGAVDFDTTGATTNGLAINCQSFVASDDQIHNDVWYRYIALCTGDLFVETCGTADFDTRLAVHPGASCPGFNVTPLACNDDAVGCPDGTSSLVVSVIAGEQLTIRVGGRTPDDRGLGTLRLSFAPRLVLDIEAEPDGFQVGESIPVELRMANLCGAEAAGFQAYIEYDEAKVQFESGVYTTEPFGLPVLFPIMATDGRIDLAAGIDKSSGQAPSSADAVLATLQFSSLVSQCEPPIQFSDNDPPSRITDALGEAIEPLQLVDAVSCAGDVNRDGAVDVDDLVAVILAWGTVSCEADANADGAVNVDDLVTVIISWGPCPDL